MRWLKILVACAFLAPQPVFAQHWATADLCRIEDPRVYPQAFGADRDTIYEHAQRQINGVGRLWKITTPSGATSHLWGTFHSNDPTILNLPPELREVLANARIVAGEYNPIPKSRRAMEAVNSDGRRWRPMRTTHKFSLPHKPIESWINSRLIARGYGDGAADGLTDIGLAEAILGDPCNDFRYGIFPIQDDRILLLGADAGAQISGLEDPDAFRDTLSRKDRADTARALIEVYGAYLNPETTKETRSTAMALYLQGQIAVTRAWDTAYITSIYGEARAAQLLALVNGYLVDERNGTFAANAKPMIDGGRAVLAVGSFHLPGEGGMVALLRREGYVVERVATAGEIP